IQYDNLDKEFEKLLRILENIKKSHFKNDKNLEIFESFENIADKVTLECEKSVLEDEITEINNKINANSEKLEMYQRNILSFMKSKELLKKEV
ncbi:MAG: hypothetical protein MHPSP_004061, partial [Paramarteilia canceri]